MKEGVEGGERRGRRIVVVWEEEEVEGGRVYSYSSVECVGSPHSLLMITRAYMWIIVDKIRGREEL